MNYGLLIGLAICVFATGVLFASTGAPVFAMIVGSTVTNAAIGWFILGATATIVSFLNNRNT